MISNTDSTLFVYSREHIRVKVYTGRAQAIVAEVGFDRLDEDDQERWAKVRCTGTLLQGNESFVTDRTSETP